KFFISRSYVKFVFFCQDEDKAGVGSGHRREIRALIKEKDLQKATIDAYNAEKERRRRIAERQKLYNSTEQQLAPESSEEPQNKKLVLEEYGDHCRIEVNQKLAALLKPHQMEGVRFLYQNTIESIDKVKEPGSGCIIAHAMGLGKTLQRLSTDCRTDCSLTVVVRYLSQVGSDPRCWEGTPGVACDSGMRLFDFYASNGFVVGSSVVTFLHTIFSYEQLGFRTALIVSPVNVLLNWKAEFDLWLDNNDLSLNVWDVINFKALEDREKVCQAWQREGGVMLISYSMLRLMVQGGKSRKSKIFGKKFASLLLDPGM
ncbi:unnamed protein product, partial [Soboliphyme baturini]|uniref:SNF2_N domain-containing protein n=1 Tax=Soboliphyme baturini TaxID=241478 RepID=A0A183J2Y1_9BILA